MYWSLFTTSLLFCICASACQSVLPTLDMSFLSISSLQDALENFGGFYLVNHPLDENLQRSMFTHSSIFFAQTKNEKRNFHIKHGLDLRWNEAGAESTYGKTDTRETLYVAPNPCNTSMSVAHFAELQSTVYDVSMIASAIGTHLLSFISSSLGLSSSHLESFFPNTPQPVLLTHSHLVPSSLNFEADAFNVGAHSDWGALTLLMLTADSHGLQVRCPSNHSHWIDVPPQFRALVVTAGDVLDTWTKGRYAASVHRVKHVSDKHRYSIPLFVDPLPELIIKPLVGVDTAGLPFRERSYHGLSNAFVHLSATELRGLLS